MFEKIYIVKSTGTRTLKGKIGIAIFDKVNKDCPIFKIFFSDINLSNNAFGLLDKRGCWIKTNERGTPKFLGAWSFDIIG